MFIINLVNSSLVLLVVLFLTYIYGKSLVYFFNYKKIKIINYNILLLPVSGFAFIVIITNFLYFFLNLDIDIILFILLFLLLFFLFLIYKQKILKDFFIIYLKLFPIILIFLSFILIQGEQFYIFRGNYWDNANYISQALLIKEYNFSEILNIKLESQNLDYTSSYLYLGRSTILVRPLVGLILAFFLKLNFIDYFYLNNLFKIYLMSLIFLSFYNLFSKIISKNAYFISCCFIFSFWSLYVYDQEALSHLATIPLFISIIFLLLSSDNKFLFNNNYNVLLFLIFNVSFFLIYPEFFAIYIFFLLFFIFFKYKLNLFIINNYKSILVLILSFLILTLPTFTQNYLFLFNQLFIAFAKPDFWGYYGAFLSGKDNSFLTLDNILFIKSIVNNDYNILQLFKAIYSIFYRINFYFLPLNIVPSFFGLYYLTLSSFSYKFYYFIQVFFLILLNIYLLKIFLNNFKSILYQKFDLIILFKSFFITFFVFILLLVLNKNFWGIIKLYLYFSPVLFLFMIISTKKKLKINLTFCILIVIFPLYKFSEFNYGISRYDTFPSIIKPEYKSKINWYIKPSIFNDCTKIKILNTDEIIIRYLSIKLNYLNYKFNDGVYEKKFNNTYVKNKTCFLKLENSNFVVND
jgi:hypothetical protein